MIIVYRRYRITPRARLYSHTLDTKTEGLPVRREDEKKIKKIIALLLTRTKKKKKRSTSIVQVLSTI